MKQWMHTGVLRRCVVIRRGGEDGCLEPFNHCLVKPALGKESALRAAIEMEETCIADLSNDCWSCVLDKLDW